MEVYEVKIKKAKGGSTRAKNRTKKFKKGAD